MPAIETVGLTKRHGDVLAVENLDLVVETGTVFGFLGPNGAGKSTTINCLLDYTRPTRGRATVLGHDVQAEPFQVRQRTGVLPEGASVYDRLTGRQHLQFAIDSKGVNDDPDAIAERVGIGEAIDRLAGGYSKGMAQRLKLGIALVGRPALLILDEPTTGLDPSGVRTMREIVREEADRGATVFFSSHILGQVEAICDRVGILRDGELIAEDTVAGLRETVDAGAALTVTVDDVPEQALAAVRTLDSVSHVYTTDTTVTVHCDSDAKTTVLGELESAGVSVRDFELDEPSLEDLFMAYMTDSTGDRSDRPGESRTASHTAATGGDHQ